MITRLGAALGGRYAIDREVGRGGVQSSREPTMVVKWLELARRRTGVQR